MTNKQLAVMLDMIATEIERLASDVSPLIIDGKRIAKRVWVGEGPEPIIDFGPAISTKGYEYQEAGDFAAVVMIADFAKTVRHRADFLATTNDE